MTAPSTEQKLLAAVLELVGGVEVWRLADRRFATGTPLRTLADETGIARQTIARQTNHAWDVAAKYGILPAGWRRHAPGRPAAPTIHYLGDAPDRHATGKRKGRTGQSVVGPKDF